MITIIAAVSEDGFIGRQGKIPWRLPTDMKHFKNITTGHTVVMGRKTWDSIPEEFLPLSHRKNVVITEQTSFSASGARVVSSVEEALSLTEDEMDVFFMGGGRVYQQVLPFAERIFVTRVKKDISGGDTRFPVLRPEDWRLVFTTEEIQNEGDECPFVIEEYSPRLRFVEFSNIRTLGQLEVMRKIREVGHCPFCMEHFHLYHDLPRDSRWEHWVVTDNQWAYPGTNVHKLVILKSHAETMMGVPPGAGEELVKIIRTVNYESEIEGGALGFRYGDPIITGATVKHLHAQIISPKKGVEPVKFYIGAGSRITVP